MCKGGFALFPALPPPDALPRQWYSFLKTYSRATTAEATLVTIPVEHQVLSLFKKRAGTGFCTLLPHSHCCKQPLYHRRCQDEIGSFLHQNILLPSIVFWLEFSCTAQPSPKSLKDTTRDRTVTFYLPCLL